MRRKGISAVLFAIVFAMVFSLIGCLNSSNNYYDFNKILLEDIEKIQDYLNDNGIDAEMDSSTGIFITIHDNPGGYKPANKGIVKFHYVGHTLEGTIIGSTYTTGIPEKYPLYTGPDQGLTIGLDIGLAAISEGDSATLYVPSGYCFQDKQAGAIPPNSILTYTVRFLDINLLEEDIQKIDQYITDKGWTAQIDPKFGTRYIIHREGTGSLPEYGNRVITHYTGQLLNETEFDSSYPSNSPLSFTLGDGTLIAGFELGLLNLQEGDSATFFIPSTYGYQDNEKTNIPANSVLVFGVDDITYNSN